MFSSLRLQGMAYLQKSKLVSHGNLRSDNCFINNRWVLKISGFGLRAFQEEKSVEMVTPDLHNNLLVQRSLLLFARSPRASNIIATV